MNNCIDETFSEFMTDSDIADVDLQWDQLVAMVPLLSESAMAAYRMAVMHVHFFKNGVLTKAQTIDCVQKLLDTVSWTHQVDVIKRYFTDVQDISFSSLNMDVEDVRILVDGKWFVHRDLFDAPHTRHSEGCITSEVRTVRRNHPWYIFHQTKTHTKEPRTWLVVSYLLYRTKETPHRTAVRFDTIALASNKASQFTNSHVELTRHETEQLFQNPGTFVEISLIANPKMARRAYHLLRACGDHQHYPKFTLSNSALAFAHQRTPAPACAVEYWTWVTDFFRHVHHYDVSIFWSAWRMFIVALVTNGSFMLENTKHIPAVGDRMHPSFGVVVRRLSPAAILGHCSFTEKKLNTTNCQHFIVPGTLVQKTKGQLGYGHVIKGINLMSLIPRKSPSSPLPPVKKKIDVEMKETTKRTKKS